MAVWIYVMKNLINPGGKKQQYFNRDDNNVLFKDIGGNDDAKSSLQEIIDYIKILNYWAYIIIFIQLIRILN